MTAEKSKDNSRWMRLAIRHARKGWGRTSPNPLVGAVVLHQGEVVGVGHHHFAGGPHAEVVALQDAGDAARGATLYVTLEPCSTTGRTGPCTRAIIDAGIRRVVVGNRDPNPAHRGRGLDVLRQAGIDVEDGVEAEHCAKLNEAFFCWIRHRRPYVVLKMAMTMDGKIATVNGVSQWITGAAARKRVQSLRQWADAVMVGGETVRRDDPQLIVRAPRRWPCQPLRLVASRTSELGAAPQVLTDGLATTRIVSCANVGEWQQLLSNLGDDGITALLVEGGGGLAAEMLAAKVVDKVQFFIAPKILGGAGSRPAVAGENPSSLDDTLNLADHQMERVGDDYLLTGYLSNVHRLD